METITLAERIQSYVNKALNQFDHRLPHLKKETILIAERLTAEITKSMFINGKDPRVVAGSIVYLVFRITEERRKQTDIALALDITVPPIRTKYHELLAYILEHKKEYERADIPMARIQKINNEYYRTIYHNV
jgi:Transcription initiation factor TFIIIB, Brf1 subunit/Transcription initiation factor TFIIB